MRSPVIYSMTGFSSLDGEILGQRIKIEIKSLNHRYLDLKVRLPREFSGFDYGIRALLQAKLKRGSVDLKLERVRDSVQSEVSSDEAKVQANLSLAASYFEALTSLQKMLGLNEPIRTIELAQFPGVITLTESESASEAETWKDAEPLVLRAVEALLQSRREEGKALTQALLATLQSIEKTALSIRTKRASTAETYPDRIRERVKTVIEAYPLPPTAAGAMAAILESRVAQELATLLERTDIEEELVRLHAHCQQLHRILTQDSPSEKENQGVGRKLEFLLQEMSREVNTLGNKAQDYAISEEVVDLKVRLENLREQVMNLE